MFTDNNEHAGPDTVQIPCSWEMKISSSKSWIVLSPKNMKFSCSIGSVLTHYAVQICSPSPLALFICSADTA